MVEKLLLPLPRPRFMVEETPKLLWKLQKTAFVLFLGQQKLDLERDSLVLFHDSV